MVHCHYMKHMHPRFAEVAASRKHLGQKIAKSLLSGGATPPFPRLGSLSVELTTQELLLLLLLSLGRLLAMLHELFASLLVTKAAADKSAVVLFLLKVFSGLKLIVARARTPPSMLIT